jgi:hypothetical protein
MDMSKQSDAVKRWRKNTKRKLIEGFGGACACCGYDKCADALELHHLDPLEKEFGLGSIMANPKKWEALVDEAKKCVLLCSNCHREHHAGITELPEDIQRFDEALIKTKNKTDKCPVCGNQKSIQNVTCSKACAAKRANKVDWSVWDDKLIDMTKVMSKVAIAEKIGVSDTAVRKRIKKLIGG